MSYPWIPVEIKFTIRLPFTISKGWLTISGRNGMRAIRLSGAHMSMTMGKRPPAEWLDKLIAGIKRDLVR